MLTLHDADAEAITGGGRLQLPKRYSRLGPSLTNNIVVAPQINVGVNLVAFGGFINSVQGNAGFGFA
jgi:hypothetical protein